MSTRNYQPEPKHRINWTKLSEDQIISKLAAAKGPTGTGTSSTLAGKSLKIVTDDGPTLEYNFRSANELTLSENGDDLTANYGALELKTLLVISHLVPDTQRGYHVIIDQHTNLATVFETWFSGYDDKRETQRQVYYGYVDNGGEVPSARHHITNRLEGKGIYWKQDNDVETLDFYCSVIFSNFIELTRAGGELTFAGPADYIMINDHEFIYSRVEAGFSGIMTLYVLDLFSVSQAGVRLGFDEQDALEYYMFTGKGEVTGQIATFEPFGDNGEEIAFGNRPRNTEKGQRLVYRPLATFPVMTDDEVRDQVINHAHAFGDGAGSGAGGMGGYKTEMVDKLVGKSLTIRMDNDGPAIEYIFDKATQLRWRYPGDNNWREAFYEMYEPDEDLYFFAHFLDAEFPRSCAMVALDMRNGLSTLVKGTTGTPYRNNETTPHFHFGMFEMEGITSARYHRHGWTSELVGEAVTWNYQPGNPGLTSMHLYATPNTYSWIIFLENGSGGMQWTSPGWYAKLRDDVYIMAWVEEACNGTLGVICYNKRTMHDAGFGFHVGPTGLSLSVIGARARHAGKFNIEKYLGPKA
ncbi:MAG: MoaF N-terminal domain-containing protein [Pseudomonadota bacterium]